ncbi:zinc ribbon domain-containing protein [Mycolicibacterium komossense]|uniref:Zinc ribbon domain-containing protein n=1 Tax=Mycolicibacterium komossense TaxID=1779 RepID=A0ABT3C6D4_9MYCO|nr:zinc ribbon domain-containing protein [Mycolicibacterium komossense]MCV7224996.1 zinc ribbon domain-containing protein [Mycolicibacterium komossense]
MKAEVTQQRSLLELTELDAELSRLAHRSTHLAEQQQYEQLQSEHQAANDRLAVLQIALDDLDGQTARFEAEIDGVRQREDRDRSLLNSGSAAAKQLSELQHELETLERRQASLEDSLLEVMERREELQKQQSDELAVIDRLQNELGGVGQARDTAMEDIESTRRLKVQRREGVTASLDADLLALYERLRATSGIGAGALQGRRCGACRIEIDSGELSRIAAADEDEVLRCPECGSILLRVKGFA